MRTFNAMMAGFYVGLSRFPGEHPTPGIDAILIGVGVFFAILALMPRDK